mmetsp:Transcript_18427/g.29983  ORF Transcript_18427/g.29983 Transcript_18427/m.29983 type:complete len:503 (+) Transcript_18427:87-1595(+)
MNAAEKGAAASDRDLIKNLDTGESFDGLEEREKLDTLLGKLASCELGKEPLPVVASDEASVSVETTSPTGGKVRSFWSALRGHDDVDSNAVDDGRGFIRVTSSSRNRTNVLDLGQLVFAQCLGKVHKGAINCLEFSPDGMFLASAGTDATIIIWRTLQCDKEEYEQCEFQRKCASFPTMPCGPKLLSNDAWRTFSGHSGEILSLAWSKSQFLLSGSKDKTVRLWHIQRPQCLLVFRHREPITSVDFNPHSDTMFVCGSKDRIIRVWNIPDARLMHWYRLPIAVTAVSFSHDASMIITGLEDGEVRFLKFDRKTGLEFFTQIECRNKRGIQRKGKKVTGIQPHSITSGPGGKQRNIVLISTNDSRVRLCSLDTYLCLCKFKGATNTTSPGYASVSETGSHVISGSEDKYVYVWNLHALTEEMGPGVTGTKKIINNLSKKSANHESFLAHGCVVTNAKFAPPRTIHAARGVDLFDNRKTDLHHALIVTSGVDGHIHVFENLKPA